MGPVATEARRRPASTEAGEMSDSQEQAPNETEAGEAIEGLRDNWERLGEADPLWAVLTEPGKQGGRWSTSEFLETGRQEVDELLASLAAADISVELGSALDFGCGAGRLSQGLARHFQNVLGIDIAESMVATARRLNESGDQCQFQVNVSPTLDGIADEAFDLIYTSRVLQHIHPALVKGYLAEFARALRFGGVAVVQMPSRPANTLMGRGMRLLPESAARVARRAFQRSSGTMQMHSIPRESIEGLATRLGLHVARVMPDNSAGPHWESYRYVLTKPQIS